MMMSVVETVRERWLQVMAERRIRRILLVGIVLLSAAAIYRFYPLYAGLRNGQGDLNITRKSIAKYRQVVEGKSMLESRLTQLAQALARAEERLVQGKTEALAAVAIQNMLNEIVLASGVEIKRMQVLKADDREQEAPYVSVPVQFSAVLTVRQLQDILYKIETCPKFYLTVQWIRIEAGSGGGQIRCDLAVAGIMKRTEG